MLSKPVCAGSTSFRLTSRSIRPLAGEIMYQGCSSCSLCVKEENKTRAKPPTPCIAKARKRHSVSTFSFRVQINQKQQQSAEAFSGVLYR